MRRLPLISLTTALAFVAVAALTARTALAEMRFEPALPDTPMKGPGAAAGALVWSHGAGGILRTDNSTLGPPYLAYFMRDRGWDVFAFKRTAMDQESNSEAKELLRQVAQLKSQGYRKIVLAGQSDGGWISVMSAGRSQDIYAIVALAPAHYGTDRPRMTLNATALFDYVDEIHGVRTMVAYFANDPYDPGGRGARTEEILARHAVPHLLLDRPEGFSGHGSGESGRFLRRFGNCVLAVAGDGPVPQQRDCETAWGDVPRDAIPLPKDLMIAPTSGGAGAAFLGKWWGTYDVGREVMLVVTKAEGDKVEAVYAVSNLPGGANATGNFTLRSGRVAGGELVFEEAEKATLRYHLLPDGRLDGMWISANAKSQLAVTLQRLPK
ncbi:MAG TPA: hypothetical protein VK433_01860 [Stellaceae bacterium]|nr:hypothetical protein [Stellaceae bacterium]